MSMTLPLACGSCHHHQAWPGTSPFRLTVLSHWFRYRPDCLFIFITRRKGVMSAPEDEEKPTFDSVKSGRDTEAKFKYVSYSCVCVCVFEAGSPSCLFACLLVCLLLELKVCVCLYVRSWRTRALGGARVAKNATCVCCVVALCRGLIVVIVSDAIVFFFRHVVKRCCVRHVCTREMGEFMAIHTDTHDDDDCLHRSLCKYTRVRMHDDDAGMQQRKLSESSNFSRITTPCSR